jgi:DNA adenine methylase
VKPPFTYYGGKTAIAGQIAGLLPEHQHYVEPFAGSLAVLLAKRPSRMETVNDIDKRLMTFWRVLRDRPADLIRACALTPHSRGEYQESAEPAMDELECARRTWVTLSQGRAGTLLPTGWRHPIDPAGRSGSVPTDLTGYVTRMEAVARRLHRVSLENRPALELIEAYGTSEKVLIYADPPYIAATRNGTNYLHEMQHEHDHEMLAAALRICRATVVLSGYHSPLYARLYGDWHVAIIAAGSGQGSVWKDRTEVLWSNRPFAQATLFGSDGAA